MQKLLLAVAACGLALSAHASPDSNAPINVIVESNAPVDLEHGSFYPVTQFIAALNAGDLDGAARYFAPSVAIIDPHSSAFAYHSFADWRRDFGAIFSGPHFTDYHVVAGNYLFVGSTSTAWRLATCRRSPPTSSTAANGDTEA